jgi:catechol 2,3-dioxygenase-like lactoylglutathione lyase family enzyme
MFSHIVVGADDIAAAKRFYDAALGALGYAAGAEMGDRVIYSAETGNLMVTKPIDGKPASFGNGVTIGLMAPNPAAVDAFHQGGIAAGGRDAGAPGPRDAIPNSYAAYLRDPTGNKLVAWCVKQS